MQNIKSKNLYGVKFLKNNSEIILTTLLNGLEFTYQNRTIKLFKEGDVTALPSGVFEAEDYWLGLKMYKNSNPVWVGFELTLTDFLNYCDALTEDEVLKHCANVTLNDCRQRKIK